MATCVFATMPPRLSKVPETIVCGTLVMDPLDDERRWKATVDSPHRKPGGDSLTNLLCVRENPNAGITTTRPVPSRQGLIWEKRDL